jgi:hypothetical protein
MGYRRIALACMGAALLLGVSAPGSAAGVPTSDDEFETVMIAVTSAGFSGTLSAPAAEKFGLQSRDYPETYVETGKASDTRRSVELVSDAGGMHIFFSQSTRVETITARSGPEGEFILGLQRQNDTADVQELTGNQGRAFVDSQLGYWLKWAQRKAD